MTEKTKVLICGYYLILLSLDALLQFPINPYGKAKKMAEDIILDFSKNSDMAVMILRFSFIFTNLLFKITCTSYLEATKVLS